jgi:hypothetical protein
MVMRGNLMRSLIVAFLFVLLAPVSKAATSDDPFHWLNEVIDICEQNNGASDIAQCVLNEYRLNEAAYEVVRLYQSPLPIPQETYRQAFDALYSKISDRVLADIQKEAAGQDPVAYVASQAFLNTTLFQYSATYIENFSFSRRYIFALTAQTRMNLYFHLGGVVPESLQAKVDEETSVYLRILNDPIH